MITKPLTFLRLTRPTLSTFIPLLPQSSPILNKPTYSFSKLNKKDLLTQMDKDILQTKQMIKNTNYDNEQHFKEQGWKIAFNSKDKIMQYTKQTNKYDVKTFAQVIYNAPNSQSDENIFEEESKSKRIRYAGFTSWIKKRQESRWIVSEMGVMDGSVVLTTLCFQNGQPTLRWNSQSYAGPDVNSVPLQIMQIIDHLYKTVGLQPKTVMNMVVHASSQTDKIDYQWLVNLKQTIQ